MNRYRGSRQPAAFKAGKFAAATSSLLATALLCTSGGAAVLAAEPALEDAMAAPAADLAQGYLSCKAMLENIFPYMDMGIAVTIHAGGETITPDNASQYKELYEKRFEAYSKAMQQRGTANFEGVYRAAATKSCARSGSSWIGIIEQSDAVIVMIAQDSGDARVTVRFRHEGKKHELENTAAIVESSIVIGDQMNSDYYSVGELVDGVVTIRPDTRVLDSWPDWAGPPKREDLLKCSVTLVRED